MTTVPFTLRCATLLSLVLCLAATSPVLAQQSQQSMPEVQDIPQTAEEPSDGGESGLLSGDKPFTLMVDENVGELVYDFDENTKELKSIHAKNGVIFASEDMTLNSDDMKYDTLNSKLTAQGKRVVVRIGEMVVTCQVFNYDPDKQTGNFEGNPIMYQKDKEGKVTTTAGRRIDVVNNNGAFQVKVVGGGGTPTYTKNSGFQGERKTLAPGQRGASMTLNTEGSGLAAPSAGGTSGGGLLPAPDVRSSTSSGSSNDANSSSSGRIDPDNSADVKNLTEKKSQ